MYKKSYNKTKNIFKNRKNRLMAVVVIVAFVSLMSLGFLTGLWSIRPPAPGNTGYCVFEMVDSETREKVDGRVMMVFYNDTNTKYITDEQEGFTNPVITGKTVYIEESVIAYVYAVTLKSSPNRRILPTSISPMCSDDPMNPKLNTIMVYFYTDVSRVDASITKIDGLTGSFGKNVFSSDGTYIFTLNIKLNKRTEYSVYGHSCFVPDYRLPATSEKLGITGYGLWLVFEGSQITAASVEGFDKSEFFYIIDDDVSILLLNSIAGEEIEQDITVTLSNRPSDVYIAEGFYEEINSRRVDI